MGSGPDNTDNITMSLCPGLTPILRPILELDGLGEAAAALRGALVARGGGHRAELRLALGGGGMGLEHAALGSRPRLLHAREEGLERPRIVVRVARVLRAELV